MNRTQANRYFPFIGSLSKWSQHPWLDQAEAWRLELTGVCRVAGRAPSTSSIIYCLPGGRKSRYWIMKQSQGSNPVTAEWEAGIPNSIVKHQAKKPPQILTCYSSNFLFYLSSTLTF